MKIYRGEPTPDQQQPAAPQAGPGPGEPGTVGRRCSGGEGWSGRTAVLQEEDCDQVKTLLWTALHWAAASDQVGLQEIQALLHFGALKSLKTGMDETPYDIAVRKNRPLEILAELQLPPAVTENKEVIENIKTVAHKIIEERVGDKIKENGMQLPQIQILWEISNECGKQKHRTVAEKLQIKISVSNLPIVDLIAGESVLYPVLGMRGGYSLDLDYEENQLYLVSWSRVDGQEERHTITCRGELLPDIADTLDLLTV